MRNVVFVFIDGLGLGPADDPANPLAGAGLDLLANFRDPGWSPPDEGGRPARLPEVERPRPLPHHGRVTATDASLGVRGLPQSATGQTTILTGENAALVLGRHLYGVPTRTLQRILLGRSVLRRVTEAGRSVVFANAFRPEFFERGETVWAKTGPSATSWANQAAGLPFLSFEDLLAGRAIYQDIDHDSLIARGLPVAPRDPAEAGAILAGLAADTHLALFEFFQTDKAGHDRDRAKAVRELTKLERFLDGLLSACDLTRTTVIVTSDHGNVEDLSTKSHTYNPVPTLVFGPDPERVAGRLGRLESVTPVLLELLGVDAEAESGT